MGHKAAPALVVPDLTAAAELLRPCLDALSCAVVMLDASNAVVAANAAAEKMFHGSDLPLLHRDPVLRELLANRRRIVTLWNRGSKFSRIRCVPLDDGCLLEVVDWTEQRGLEKQLQQAREDLDLLQARQEELLTAYELASTDGDDMKTELQEQHSLVDELFTDNLTLLKAKEGAG